MLASATAGRATQIACALLTLALLCCGSPRPPLSGQHQDPSARTPLILVPGTTGSSLRDRQTHEVAWGNAARLFSPRDGGYALALPVGSPAGSPRRLEAFRVIEEVSLLGVWKKQIYGPIFRLLVDNGYRLGDLRDPRPGDSFFPFAYDWREDNVHSARLLARQLELLRQRRAASTLRIDLLCQSSGAHVCRYLTKYGGAPLPEAEAGGGGPPPGIEIGKLILVGASNGGSLRILRELNRGRAYVPGAGRRWSQEALFTFPSLYQDLPAYRRDLFVSSRGEALEVDLYDPANWQIYGWSIFARDVQRRLARRRASDLFADAEARTAYLSRCLSEARRFQRLLTRDLPDLPHTRYYLLGNVYEETPDRALLVREADGWHTYFTGDPELKRDQYLRSRTSAPGDGHATRASQLWLSPQERSELAAEPFHVRGDHFELILSIATARRLLELLAD